MRDSSKGSLIARTIWGATLWGSCRLERGIAQWRPEGAALGLAQSQFRCGVSWALQHLSAVCTEGNPVDRMNRGNPCEVLRQMPVSGWLPLKNITKIGMISQTENTFAGLGLHAVAQVAKGAGTSLIMLGDFGFSV